MLSRNPVPRFLHFMPPCKTLKQKYTLLTIGREETTQRAWKEGKTLKFAIISHNCSAALAYNSTFLCYCICIQICQDISIRRPKITNVFVLFGCFSFWNHLSQLLCQLKANRNHWHLINTVQPLNARKLILI